MQINLNYQLKIQVWVVSIIFITAIAIGAAIDSDRKSQSDAWRSEIKELNQQLLEKDEAIKQCNSKRIQDSIKNSINNTPNIPADEYMKRYKIKK